MNMALLEYTWRYGSFTVNLDTSRKLFLFAFQFKWNPWQVWKTLVFFSPAGCPCAMVAYLIRYEMKPTMILCRNSSTIHFVNSDMWVTRTENQVDQTLLLSVWMYLCCERTFFGNCSLSGQMAFDLALAIVSLTWYFVWIIHTLNATFSIENVTDETPTTGDFAAVRCYGSYSNCETIWSRICVYVPLLKIYRSVQKNSKVILFESIISRRVFCDHRHRGRPGKGIRRGGPKHTSQCHREIQQTRRAQVGPAQKSHTTKQISLLSQRWHG